MNQKVIAVVGAKKVGKTTTTENLIAELTNRGYKVAAIKHISEPDWTIDKPGKDTYRFAQKGAKIIIAIAANEITTIEKTKTEKISFNELIKKAKGYDIILTEGLKKEVAKKTSIPKIVIVTTKEEAENALKTYKPVLAFSGPYNTQNINCEIPYVNARKEPEKLATLIEEKIIKA